MSDEKASGSSDDGQHPSLEERVAALEALAVPPLPSAELWTSEQVAEFRERFAEALAERHQIRVIPQPPPLTPEQVRYLLRECVTVVKPGETLVIRGDWTPAQVQELQWFTDAMHADGTIPFKVLIAPGDEMGVVQPEDDAAFLARLERVLPELMRREMKRAAANYRPPRTGP